MFSGGIEREQVEHKNRGFKKVVHQNQTSELSISFSERFHSTHDQPEIIKTMEQEKQEDEVTENHDEEKENSIRRKIWIGK